METVKDFLNGIITTGLKINKEETFIYNDGSIEIRLMNENDEYDSIVTIETDVEVLDMQDVNALKLTECNIKKIPALIFFQ